jgi:hypothetical protein
MCVEWDLNPVLNISNIPCRLAKSVADPLDRPFKCLERCLQPKTNGDRNVWVGLAVEDKPMQLIEVLVPLAREQEGARTLDDEAAVKLVEASNQIASDYHEGQHVAAWLQFRNLEDLLAKGSKSKEKAYDCFVVDCVTLMRLPPVGRTNFNTILKR